MFGSLRFRLPALFLLGILLAGLIASLISVRFFQSYTRARAVDELRSESVGIVQLYAQQAGRGDGSGAESRPRARRRPDLLGAGRPRRERCCQGLPDIPTLDRRHEAAQSRAHGDDRPSLAGEKRTTSRLHGRSSSASNLFGALVVAKPTSQLRSRSVTLVERLGLAFGGGVIVAGLLGLYFTRRITEPLRKLSQAADEVAAGHYDVEVPHPRGSDEIAHLSARFADMAAKLAESEQLSRNFLMSVSHELRTPLTAIRGHVSALQRRRDRRSDDA